MSELFSEKHGLQSARESLQRTSLEDGTKNRLWTWFGVCLPAKMESLSQTYFRFFDRVLKMPKEQWPKKDFEAREWIQKNWPTLQTSAVFDLIDLRFKYLESDERVYVQGGGSLSAKTICRNVNTVLEEEGVAWRVRQGIGLIPSFEIDQMDAIEQAATASSTTEGARDHIVDAILKFRHLKDYSPEQVILEAVSAVEKQCQGMSGNEKASLPAALVALTKKRNLNPNLKSALEKLFVYSSDEEGILDLNGEPEVNATVDDAAFMLVACSAFITWLGSHQELLQK